MKVEIEGLNDVLSALDKIADSSNLSKGMENATALVERAAKQNAPKDTGALRRSIESKVEVGENSVVGTVFTNLEYAPYVEYGTGLFAEKGGRSNVPWKYEDEKGEFHSTSGQKPQPYLRPALLNNQEQIKKLLQEGMKK